jgi:hypothetical protein
MSQLVKYRENSWYKVRARYSVKDDSAAAAAILLSGVQDSGLPVRPARLVKLCSSLHHHQVAGPSHKNQVFLYKLILALSEASKTEQQWGLQWGLPSTWSTPPLGEVWSLPFFRLSISVSFFLPWSGLS